MELLPSIGWGTFEPFCQVVAKVRGASVYPYIFGYCEARSAGATGTFLGNLPLTKTDAVADEVMRTFESAVDDTSLLGAVVLAAGFPQRAAEMPLERLSRHQDEPIRRSLANTLGRIDHPRCLSILRTLRDDAKQSVRRAALASVQEKDGEEALTLLIDGITQGEFADPYSDLAKAIATVAKRGGSIAPAGVIKLCKCVSRVPVDATWEVMLPTRDEWTADYWVAVLDEQDWPRGSMLEAKTLALRALRELDAAVYANAVVERFDSLGDDVKIQALEIANGINIPDAMQEDWTGIIQASLDHAGPNTRQTSIKIVRTTKSMAERAEAYAIAVNDTYELVRAEAIAVISADADIRSDPKISGRIAGLLRERFLSQVEELRLKRLLIRCLAKIGDLEELEKLSVQLDMFHVDDEQRWLRLRALAVEGLRASETDTARAALKFFR